MILEDPGTTNGARGGGGVSNCMCGSWVALLILVECDPSSFRPRICGRYHSDSDVRCIPNEHSKVWVFRRRFFFPSKTCFPRDAIHKHDAAQKIPRQIPSLRSPPKIRGDSSSRYAPTQTDPTDSLRTEKTFLPPTPFVAPANRILVVFFSPTSTYLP